jgi:hypothetical protein
MLIERPSSDMPNSEQQLRPNNSQSDNQAFELKLLCYSEKLFLFYQLAPSENLIFSRAFLSGLSTSLRRSVSGRERRSALSNNRRSQSQLSNRNSFRSNGLGLSSGACLLDKCSPSVWMTRSKKRLDAWL